MIDETTLYPLFKNAIQAIDLKPHEKDALREILLARINKRDYTERNSSIDRLQEQG